MWQSCCNPDPLCPVGWHMEPRAAVGVKDDLVEQKGFSGEERSFPQLYKDKTPEAEEDAWKDSLMFRLSAFERERVKAEESALQWGEVVEALVGLFLIQPFGITWCEVRQSHLTPWLLKQGGWLTADQTTVWSNSASGAKPAQFLRIADQSIQPTFCRDGHAF